MFSRRIYPACTVLLGDSKENIQRLQNEFDKVCERRKLKVNTGKSKVLVWYESRRGTIEFKFKRRNTRKGRHLSIWE